ncbi:hypothetical protein L917_07677 [Phytophthora nicotianae]|uniref:Uncharacterized protein n=1 Tax=Phytophthora nicotianae TaxID=4792 RepID=W2LC41_PHYNI|nr:hypothetical protein L917_07677 [Phytophthora nicotianae]
MEHAQTDIRQKDEQEAKQETRHDVWGDVHIMREAESFARRVVSDEVARFTQQRGICGGVCLFGLGLNSKAACERALNLHRVSVVASKGKVRLTTRSSVEAAGGCLDDGVHIGQRHRLGQLNDEQVCLAVGNHSLSLCGRDKHIQVVGAHNMGLGARHFGKKWLQPGSVWNDHGRHRVLNGTLHVGACPTRKLGNVLRGQRWQKEQAHNLCLLGCRCLGAQHALK